VVEVRDRPRVAAEGALVHGAGASSPAAAIARHIDETRGFVVIDDLESVGRTAETLLRQPSFCWRLSSATARKPRSRSGWGVSKGNKVEKLNFFGVKMINNTSGVEAILGSRMLRITSGKIPEALRTDFIAGFDAELAASLPRLRDEFHTWNFENVSPIAEAYATMFPKSTDRANEISAPLRVMATFIENPDLRAGLERALERTQRGVIEPDSRIDILREAAKRLLLAATQRSAPPISRWRCRRSSTRTMERRAPRISQSGAGPTGSDGS
jgi:hypothetical protein